MTETQVVTSLLKKLKEHGFFWKASDKFHAGIPDIIGCVEGRFLGIEVKIDNGKPTPLQKHYLGKIKAIGGFAEVITYKNKTKKYLIDNAEFSKQGVIEWILKHLALNIS